MKTLIPLLALLSLSSIVLAAPVTYPGPITTDDTGAVVYPTSITVASVTDLDGNAISTPGAVAHVAGPNTSAVYDAAAKGEAWITLTPVLSGHTFVNSPPRIFASADPQALATVNTTTTGTNTLATGINTQTAKIATNAMDSPNEITAQGLVTSTNTQAAKISTNAMDSPNEITSQGNASTLLLSLATYQSVLTAGSTSSVLSTALTGTADLSGAKVVFTTGINKGVTRTITSMNSGTGAITLLTATPSTPGATDAFSVVQGSKALEQFLAALGTDSKPFLTATDTQAQSEAAAALVAQGYTSTRAAKMDNLDAAISGVPAAVWVYTASDGLTHQQSDALRTSILARGFSVSYNASTRTQITTYFKADNTTVIATTTVIYDTTGRAVTRTTAFTNLP